jgi:hypothetical protein
MEEIPKDVWQAANMAVANAPEYTEQLHKDVARAILAERERCAKVAETIDTDEATQDHGDFVDGAGWASCLIAQRIRTSAHDH